MKLLMKIYKIIYQNRIEGRKIHDAFMTTQTILVTKVTSYLTFNRLVKLRARAQFSCDKRKFKRLNMVSMYDMIWIKKK